MGFIGSHYTRVNKRIPALFRDVKRGTVIEANYLAEYRGRPKRSLYLVLLPWWNLNNTMHVLDLDFVKRTDLERLKATPIESDYRGKKYTRLQYEDSSLQTYINHIKGRQQLTEGYRTLKRTNSSKQGFKQVSIVDYDFGGLF